MVYGVITFILLAVFLIFYLTDRRRIINGFLFNLFFCSFLVLSYYLAYVVGIGFFRLFVIVPLLIFFFILTFGLFALMIGLFLNARILIKREGRRLSNCLTLISGLGIIIFFLLSVIDPARFLSPDVQPLFAGSSLITIYFFFHLTNFLTAYFLYQFNRPKLNQDYIIVLGSGLINDTVPPLLASRINKAVDFYWKQTAVASPPKIIFSGGQGLDENLSEAEAMQRYAIKKGIPGEHTLKEDRSVNTYQNMLFSKQLMDSLTDSKYNSIFTTNNFHLFRASLYAKRAGLKSDGIGSKTAFYYWPNAMIREYIAVVVMNRKRHSIVVGTILGISILLTAFNFFID
ncbi:YdcF family protein [Bacillus paralicheniformis]|uniref:YdcF family protein n=1 Tax=Bacillus paralicheniformis TaxID=1648923 RepID=UPI003981BA96